MKRVALTVLLLALGVSAYSQMYRWVDKDGRVHYTDTPPPDQPKQKPYVTKQSPARPPSGEAKGEAEATPSGAGQQATAGGNFLPEEQAALGVLCGIAITEVLQCGMVLNRYCSLDELVKGGPGGKPKAAFEKDPNADPNYRYRVDIRGEDITFSATPRKPGLAGFFNDGNGARYNPNGQATKNDKLVKGGVNCTGFTK